MTDFSKILDKAKELEAQMKKSQEKIKNIEVEGLSGANSVKVILNGEGEMVKLEISPETIKEEKAIIEDLIVAAYNNAKAQLKSKTSEEISKITHDAGALLLLDAVTSLGGCPVRIDEWAVDVVYSGTQKCLSCPPGLSPVSLSNRAMEQIKSRGSNVQSWYLDVNLLANYWGEGARVYHHTAPVTMNYALHEALRLTLEEGLEKRWARHEANHLRLRNGLVELGLGIIAQEGHQLWQINAVGVPEGVDEAEIRAALLNEHQIEVGPGLGPLQGKVWRIGLMGHSSREDNVDRVLAALKALL